MAQMQSIAYSTCYGENCAKRGIHQQPCGLKWSHSLLTGSISDTQYQKTSGIFETQKEFVLNDLVNSSVKSFVNILDKGYSSSIQAWEVGRQILKQPVFVKSDKTFIREETISFESIVANRSGNERARKRAKESVYVNMGLDPAASFELMDYEWSA